MARSTNRTAEDGDSRVSAPTDRGEARDLAEPRELSLEEVLKSYEQPINEEQAWSVCYQCCSGLRVPRPPAGRVSRVKDPSSIHLHRDGTVSLQQQPRHNDDTDGPPLSPSAERQLVQSLGVAIYRALDWGLDDSEERELSPQLERLIERMAAGDQDGEGDGTAGNGVTDEGYSGQEEEEEDEEQEGVIKPVCTFRQVMALCASRLANPNLAPEHYQAVCRALFVETLELQTFLIKIRNAKEMLKKITTEEAVEDRSTAELDALKHRDWARLWVQLMKELRQGVKLKKVQEQPFNPLPTEFSLTPFEMLMQDIRTRKFQLRKVMVGGDIPSRVKRNAHELILDFIRSRPPLKPVSERSLPPPPPQQQSLHDQVLAEIKQERKLRPVVPDSSRPFGSLPCLAQTCPCNVKSTSCIDLSVSEPGPRLSSRPRILLKAPTLAEMEEMNIFEEEESPDNGELRRAESSPTPLKRDRSFSEHDLALLRGEMLPSLSESAQLGEVVRLRGERPRSRTLTGTRPPPDHRASFPVHGWLPPSPARLSLSSVDETTEGSETTSGSRAGDEHQWMEEFSHPVESLALTVDEVINVRRVLVKAEMEKFLQSKELYSNLKRGKVCCCCRVKFPLFSWPSTCLLCKRSVCSSCSAKMKIPSKKMAHIPGTPLGFHHSKSLDTKPEAYKSLRSLSRRSVEEEFPHLYAHGCTLRDICAECTKFIADVISSSRRSLDILNNTPKREAKAAAAAAAAQRPQLQRQSHLETCPQPNPQCHPPPHPQPQRHPQIPPQPHHQQQRLHAPSSSPSPQLHAKTINNVNQ
ncbi:LOW QUALITY PROTEIN: protein spire homolog 2 [Morone saxatilis]|uniref:LOW QUALITY PROTEIN: protein spire homolog 2 n=1 Tax=Morone saxatilis TaxID=34816 RepID=UPI0015E231BD|nr:LOW QUALITY PROTEIN: protein spire homolog 2 [Morone saxatilis]